MVHEKKLTLLLLKQVLWGVRRGNKDKGICDAFASRLVRVFNKGSTKGTVIDYKQIREIRKRIMLEAARQLGWYSPVFPVPNPNCNCNLHAFLEASDSNSLWDGRYGMNRMRLLCRMIWVLKTEIHLEKSK